MPIGSGGGGGGGPAAGTYLPVADPSSVTVNTTTYANTIRGGGNKLTTLVFPRDTGALAFAVAGDAFPRFLIGTDLNNAGIGLSDGTFDPNGGTAYIYLTGGGTLGFGGYTPPVTSVLGRTGAVAAVNGDYMGVVAAALTGATQASRYVGATASGAPVAGTFAIGDFVVDRAGGLWVCTVAGTPGTWRGMGVTILAQQELVSGGTAVSIANGATGNLTFNNPAGTALLNLTTPSAPTIVEAGTYAFTATVTPTADLTASGGYEVDATFLTHTVGATSPPATTAIPRPRVSVAAVSVIAAGGALSVAVQNLDGVATRTFTLRAALQRLG